MSFNSCDSNWRLELTDALVIRSLSLRPFCSGALSACMVSFFCHVIKEVSRSLSASNILYHSPFAKFFMHSSALKFILLGLPLCFLLST